MSQTNQAPLPSFAEFYCALYPDRSPFPWQVRLAELVTTTYHWPNLLDLPTGSGKMSVLDVAIYCLAVCPECMPRRVLLVVDRRLVVDQGAVHARSILCRLQAASDGPLLHIAQALRSLFAKDPSDTSEAPFTVAVMRGGMPRDNDWAKRPDQPVVGVSTVDQVGSRILFRGYGVGQKSASIHAGLLANDTLILLDEVHLSIPFAQTLDAIDRLRSQSPKALPSRFAVVRMSATPTHTQSHWNRFQLSDDDKLHPILNARLNASKLARLESVTVKGDSEPDKRATFAQAIARSVDSVVSGGARVVGVVLNRVDSARAVASVLDKEERFEVRLVTGRMRAIERDHLTQTWLLPKAGMGHPPSDLSQKPVVVVSTQCIEAGADLDFDALVTECASLDALKQRFGRLNRSGRPELQAQAVILVRSDALASNAKDPIYDSALAATWNWLQEVAVLGRVNFGILALPPPTLPDGMLNTGLFAPSLDAPVLLPAHLDAWSQTSPKPTPDHDIALWLHGYGRAVADVQIIWRVGVSLDTSLHRDFEKAKKRSLKRLVDRLSACRPSSLEAVTIPIYAAKRWLMGEDDTFISDVVSFVEPDEQKNRHKEKAKNKKLLDWVLKWDGEDSDWVQPQKIRPGDILVVDSSLGGMSQGSFDPHAKEPVIDLGDLAQLRARGLVSVRYTTSAIQALSKQAADEDAPSEILTSLEALKLKPSIVRAAPIRSDDELLSAFKARFCEWIDSFPPSILEDSEDFLGTEAEWDAIRHDRSLKSKLRLDDIHGTVCASWVSQPQSIKVSSTDLRLVLGESEIDEARSEDDDSAFQNKPVTLSLHCGHVQRFAEHFARAVGLSDELVEDITLAAWLHDVGKADRRFQCWLMGGSEVQLALQKEPLAKSAFPSGNRFQRQLAKKRAAYPDGYRHEILSLHLIEQHQDVLSKAHDRELVLHLVASHHGWCRPFAPLVDHPERIPVSVSHGDVQLRGDTRHQRARLDSGVADRFWLLTDRYGWWGLAWLEAILRLADHRSSALETGGH